MIQLLQDISYSYPIIFARTSDEQQHQESYTEMVDMVYKIHPISAAEEGYPIDIINTVSRADFVGLGIQVTGVSRLPAAEQDIIRSTSGSDIYHDSLHVKGGDCPKIMDNIQVDNIKKLVSQMRNIVSVKDSCIYFDVLDNMKGLARKSLSCKGIDVNLINLIGGIRLVSDKWYPVGIGYHLLGIYPFEPTKKASLFK